jgi:hypothetical protein
MHVSSILRRCLAPVLDPMHGARRKRLLTAVDALASGRRLSLTARARSWPDGSRGQPPIERDPTHSSTSCRPTWVSRRCLSVTRYSSFRSASRTEWHDWPVLPPAPTSARPRL